MGWIRGWSMPATSNICRAGRRPTAKRPGRFADWLYVAP